MSVFEGNWLWLWQMEEVHEGRITKIIEEAKGLQIRGVLVKAHDGTLKNEDRYLRQFKELVGPLKEAGFLVGAWGYIYGNEPELEGEAAVKAIKEGANCYVYDVESEFEYNDNTKSEKYEKAERFCSVLDKKYPKLEKGFTSFPITKYHPLPYEIFSYYADVVLPQVYWGAIGWELKTLWEETHSSWKQFNRRILPVGQSYDNVSSEEMLQFVDLVINDRCSGVSWWSWQHANKGQLHAIKTVTDILPARSLRLRTRVPWLRSD